MLLYLIPSVPGFHGDPDRHSLAVATLGVAIVLLCVYAVVTFVRLRRESRAHTASGHAPEPGGWSLPTALAALAVATLATAIISEILVHSLESFAHTVGVSEFFIAVVIVAIVGNAAEHGGAVVIARRGKMKLATEIAVSSSAQVALLVAGAVAVVSWAIEPLSLAFRPIELITMGASAAFVAFVSLDGRSRRWEGALLIAAYCATATWYFLAGDRPVG